MSETVAGVPEAGMSVAEGFTTMPPGDEDAESCGSPPVESETTRFASSLPDGGGWPGRGCCAAFGSGLREYSGCRTSGCSRLLYLFGCPLRRRFGRMVSDFRREGKPGREKERCQSGSRERSQPPSEAAPGFLSEIFGHDFLDDLPADGLLLVAETGDQGIVAKDVDDPGDSSRRLDDGLQRSFCKNHLSESRRLGQAVLDVGKTFRFGKRVDLLSNGNPLSELPQFVQIEDPFQLGLPDQKDLKEFVFGGLQVGEHAQVLKSLYGHVLRFIDDQDDGPVAFILIDEDVVEAIDHGKSVVTLGLVAEFSRGSA